MLCFPNLQNAVYKIYIFYTEQGLVSILALTQTGIFIPLVLTAVYAFLSIRFDGTSILDFIRYAIAFLITKQQFYEWRM